LVRAQPKLHGITRGNATHKRSRRSLSNAYERKDGTSPTGDQL
jgi:hypothetical protein